MIGRAFHERKEMTMSEILSTLPIQIERQCNSIGDEVSAVTAVVRPILQGVLLATKMDILAQAGGHEGVKLKMLARLRKAHDGECGICFEYAVHDAVKRGEAAVLDRLSTALHQFCKVRGRDTKSILFGAEKSGAVHLIDTSRDLVTSGSSILVGKKGRPANLAKYIDRLAAAFRRPQTRKALPYSISGLWRADLFVGSLDTEHWVGTTVKVNQSQLQSDRGLRIGIVPTQQGASDRVRKDEQKNLIVCPLPYDASFMEVFYKGWQVVQHFLKRYCQELWMSC